MRKKDYPFIVCVDFRKLNDTKVNDSYSLARIDYVLDVLAGISSFSTLHLHSGYWQPEGYAKTALSVRSGLYEFNLLLFGMCNGHVTFERLMDVVFDALNWESALVYLVDVIVFEKPFEEDPSRIESLKQRLQGLGVKVNATKCRLI